MTKILFDEFVNGRRSNFSQEEKELFNRVILTVPGYKYIKPSFLIKSSQQCNNLFTSIRFRGMSLTWKGMRSESSYNSLKLGPHHFTTDFGACCTFIPHMHMKPINVSLTPEEVYHGLKADALNGQSNGLEFVLDAEQFNYGYCDSNSAGFRISLHSHLDKPMIQFSSQLVHPGTETQINLKPTLSYTTDKAIKSFAPKERGCYAEGEANLTYLPHYLGFRYEMNNCLIDQGIRDIIWNCRCVPIFGLGGLDPAGKSVYQDDYHDMPRCRGEKLHCANSRMKFMGMETPTTVDNIVVSEAKESLDKIGKITKPEAINCMPACKVQDNNSQMSLAAFPQSNIFFHQKLFCVVASHIWQTTCQDENRAYFVNKKQPLLCPLLKDFDNFFGVPPMTNKTVRFYSFSGYQLFK